MPIPTFGADTSALTCQPDLYFYTLSQVAFDTDSQRLYTIPWIGLTTTQTAFDLPPSLLPPNPYYALRVFAERARGVTRRSR